MAEGDTFDDMLNVEREQLVRLCTRLSGSADAGQDLAQETLVEAWRCRHKLVDATGRRAWLGAIARNVCRRWARQRGHDGAFLMQSTALVLDEIALDEVTIEEQVEENELADLLRESLERLPDDSRKVVTGFYVEGRSRRDLAAFLGTTEAAVAMRLQRGKQALRHILTTELRREAAAYGLVPPEAGAWQPSRIWCWCCGEATLRFLVDAVSGRVVIRCAGCGTETRDCVEGLAQIKGQWRLLTRSQRQAHTYFRGALDSGAAPCGRCGRMVPLRLNLPTDAVGRDRHWGGVSLSCPQCGTISQQPALGLISTLPAVERFWREHRRIRVAAQVQMDGGENPLVRTRFESRTRAVALEIVTRRDTFDVVDILSA